MKSSFKFMPIGLLLKKLDIAITAASDKILSRSGLTRIQWQTLNVIKREKMPTQKVLQDKLGDFASPNELRDNINKSIHSGIIVRDGETFRFTEKGHSVLDEAIEAQDTVRATLSQDISDEEYTSTMRTLTKMLHNFSSTSVFTQCSEKPTPSDEAVSETKSNSSPGI